MADLTKTIQIVFDSVDNTAGVIGAIGDDLGSLATGVAQATQPVRDLTEKLAMIEAAMLAAGAAAVVFSGKIAGDFNANFSEISTLVAGTEQDLAGFRDELLEYSAQSSFSFDAVAEAMKIAAGQGFEFAASMELVTTAEQLAVAGNGDLEDSTRLLLVALEAYGATSAESARYAEVLFNTVLEGGATFADLSTSMGDVLKVASNAGASIEEVGAAIAILTKTASASESVTQLTSLLLGISAPADGAAKAAHDLGVSLGGTTLQTMSLTEWLQQVAEKTGLQSDKLKDILPRTEGFQAALSLARGAGIEFSDMLQLVGADTDHLSEAYERMVDNIEKVNQRLINSIMAVLVEAGTPFEERWAEIAAGISSVFTAIRTSLESGAFDEVYTAFDGFADYLLQFFKDLSENLPAALNLVEFGGLLDSLQDLGVAILKAFDIDPANSVKLSDAIQKVVDSAESLTRTITGMVPEFAAMLQKMDAALEAYNKLSPAQKEAAGGFLAIGTNINLIAQGVTPLTDALGGLSTVLAVIAGGQIITFFKGLLGLEALGGLAVTATAATAAVSPLASALLGLATAWAGFEAGKIAGDFLNLGDKADTLGEKFAAATYKSEFLAGGFKSAQANLDALSAATGGSISTFDQMSAAADRGVIVWDKTTNSWVLAKDAIADLGKNATDAKDPLTSLGDAAKTSADGTTEIGTAAEATSGKVEVLRGTLSTVESSIRLYGVGASSAAASTKDAHDKISDLANDSSLKNLTFDWELNVENIKANAQIAISAVTEMGDVFKESTALLGQLFGLLVNPDLSSDIRQKIIDQIDTENKIRSETFEIIKAVNQASIDYYNAKTEALKSDKALITIDGGNLQPHLEAFMWEILNTIQVRVNESGLEMLVGLA